MPDNLPRGFNYKFGENQIVFIGRDANNSNVHLYFRNENGTDTRIVISPAAYSGLRALISGNVIERKDEFNDIYSGDQFGDDRVKVRTFKVPEKEKEPQKKPLFDWE